MEMRNGSAYISTIIYTTKKLAKLSRSLRHSLRVEIDGESSISYKKDKSNMNKILFKGESEEFLQNLNEMTEQTYLDYIDAVIKSNQDMEVEKLKSVKISSKDSQVRSKSLKYLKTNIQDKEFKELLEKFAENPHRVNKNNLIIYFDTLNTKKVAEKNLHKYISVVEKVGKAQERREAKLSVDKVEFVEMVVKIPFENGITNISSEDMLLYNQDFFKRNFPDYDIVVGVSHNDELHQSKKPENIEKWEKEHNQKYEPSESGYHSHLFINTKNKKTGEFDYWIQQHLLVAKYLQSKGFSEEIIRKDIGYIDDKGIRHQTLTQVKNQGKNLQELIYEDINQNLFNGKDYNAVIGFNDLTITQKQEMENNKRQSINNRQYSGNTYEEEQKQERIEQLNSKIIELESEVDYLSQEQIRENELKIKNDLKVKEVEELNHKIIKKREEEVKIDKSIQKLKEDRKKVSKEGMEQQIKSVVRKVVDNTDNYNYKFVDKDKMKSQMIKEVRKFLKVDMYDNDVKVITERIQTEANNKVLEIKNQMGDLQEKYDTLDTEHTKLEDNVESVVAGEVEKVEDTYKSTISTLEDNHKNSITALERDYKEKVDNLQTEHNQETYKLNNIIDNRDDTITKLGQDKSKLQIQVKKLQDRYQSFKNKIKSMFIRNSDLNNGLKNIVDKLQDTTNDFREKVSDLEYDIKLINEYDNNLIPKLLKEDEERIVELFNSDRIILGEPTEGEEPRLIIEPLDTKSLEINFDKDKEDDKNQSHSTGHRQ